MSHLAVVVLVAVAGVASFETLGGAMAKDVSGDAAGGARATAPMAVAVQAGTATAPQSTTSVPPANVVLDPSADVAPSPANGAGGNSGWFQRLGAWVAGATRTSIAALRHPFAGRGTQGTVADGAPLSNGEAAVNPPRPRVRNGKEDPDRSPYIRSSGEAFDEMRSRRMRNEYESETELLALLDAGGLDERLEDAVFVGLIKHYGYDNNDLKCAETNLRCLRDQFKAVRERCTTDVCRAATDAELARREVYVKANANSPELTLFNDDKDKPEEADAPKYVDGDLFVNGVSSLDVEQGGMGDCYLLSALAALAESDPDLLQSNIRDNHDGTFSVRFYENGKPVWIDVTPELTPDAASVTPEVARTDDNELWVALYEKAYTQWKGDSYADIFGGFGSVVTEELTGHGESFKFDDTGMNAWKPGDQAWSVREEVKERLLDEAGAIGAISAIQAGPGDDVLQRVSARNRDQYPDGVPSSHEYFVQDATADYVILGNPWGAAYGNLKLTWEEYFHLCPGVTFVGA